jgi:hypothetical protein
MFVSKLDNGINIKNDVLVFSDLFAIISSNDRYEICYRMEEIDHDFADQFGWATIESRQQK